ncbi:MAG: transketolase [Alphaproteobacteria bacterium]|jgi:transketolase|nr:transketolase [Alphaproteobacteria bacterium]MBT4084054.1 transketolase [Alphaproteobacteria bacterium]MBT4545746.1 transketolase [Alphaproteobacteria bacterium]MBT7744839.1 transketolase [Alphaproteobacteria bacterium]
MSLAEATATSNSPEHNNMANAIRALAMDAVQAANSGHPGMPMGMADVATVLFTKFLKYDASWADFPDRDRFVLSAGHGSMLLYSLLYLNGYDKCDIDQLRNFRQLGSMTAGHPETGHLPGIETTTGPLGQGLANAVGMALAERHLAARYGADIVDHYTYAIAGDGCLMEGISQEAISMAGHLNLNRLIVLWDDNGISIDGSVDIAASDDQLARFMASGWDVSSCDGHNAEEVAEAIEAARKSDKPSLIACRTVIGFGAPNKQGTSGVHGAPLGDDEIAAARKALGWSHAPFEIPDDVLKAWRDAGSRGKSVSAEWNSRLAGLDATKLAEFNLALSGELPGNWQDTINSYKKSLSAEAPGWATRKSSQEALKVINPILTSTMGGSADLTGSNNTDTPDLGIMSADNYAGRYVHYGIREHGMGAVMNGLALHGGVIPYGGTFLVFSDYLRPALRMSALMNQRVVYVLTHDSIGLGEDGPTHQPVEHIPSMRAIPNVAVFRPADAVETAECWALAMERRDGPSVLALTRQGLALQRTEHTDENLCATGAYELLAADGDAKVTLLATGSEVGVAVEARDKLQAEGIGTRVISVPCLDIFAEQSDDDRAKILGPGTVRVSVEAAIAQGWEGYSDVHVGMTGFGASAPAKDLYVHFGITADAVAAAAKSKL